MYHCIYERLILHSNTRSLSAQLSDVKLRFLYCGCKQGHARYQEM